MTDRDHEPQESCASRTAAALARALLLLYPAAFRREVGQALIRDVRRRAAETAAGEHAAPRSVIGLVRLGVSLLANAVAAWIEQSSVLWSGTDLTLALRLFVKYPGLTLVGGLGIAVAVAIGVGFFALFHTRFYPDLPLPDGDRVVALENWNRRTHKEERRALFDFTQWRAMTSVEDLTAFHDVSRNVITRDGGVEVAQVAEITPSGFRLAHVPPLLGRTLTEADAAPGASPVLMIGADVWRSRFHADAGVINQLVQLDNAMYTIVGVMPDGFAFPVNHHYWIPLSLPSGVEPGRGPSVFVAGRLAPGRTVADAQAELAAIGARMAAAHPTTHDQLRPEILPYTYPFAGMNAASADAFWPVTVLISLILLVVSVNVAILIYARTATRLGEIAVRSALGASRARIVAQLAAESLLLAIGAALVGLLAVKVALDWARNSLASIGQAHFWTDYTLPPAAIAYCGVLTALAVVLTGVVPALRATRRSAQYDLRRTSNGSDARLGRTWTALIVAQVAVASAAMPLAIGLGWFQIRDIFNLPRFPVERILFAEISAGADLSRLHDRLARSLDAEPSIESYAFTTNLPNIGRPGRVEIEPDSASTSVVRNVQPSTVGLDFFRAFDMNLLAGRGFSTADFSATGSDVVVVNRAFVERLLSGRDALARRLRFVQDNGSSDAPGPWLHIVGVVENIDRNPFGDDLAEPRVYEPLTNWASGSVRLAVRLAPTDRAGLARTLPQLAAAIDPSLQVKIVPLDDVYRLQRIGLTTAAAGIGIALASVIFLSAAGIYALMSFTVTERRREIAVRSALGAQPARLIGAIFSRAARQISIGVGVGVAIAVLIDSSGDGEALAGHGGVVLPLIVAVMGVVGLLAAFGPARRGLRIDPADALKSE